MSFSCELANLKPQGDFQRDVLLDHVERNCASESVFNCEAVSIVRLYLGHQWECLPTVLFVRCVVTCGGTCHIGHVVGKASKEPEGERRRSLLSSLDTERILTVVRQSACCIMLGCRDSPPNAPHPRANCVLMKVMRLGKESEERRSYIREEEEAKRKKK